MQQSQREVLILKPTPVFLSFLAAQLPDIDLPELDLLQTDSTAYTITKQASDEATLDEIERLFPSMFRHEIGRWLGDDARNEIEGSFLDFLCCFKFELHSEIVLMESSMGLGRQLLCVKPRSVLLKWIKAAAEDHDDLSDLLESINVSQLAENATVLIKNFNQLTDIKTFVRQYYRPLFKAEMLRMCEQANQWPDIDSFQTFNRYFSVEIHTQLVHLH